MPATISIYLALIVVITMYCLKRWFRKSFPLPPGPKGYPLIGNIYDIPVSYPWIEYARWSQKYGDICSFTIFDKTNIVLNSLDAVTELLEKRSGIYSDRPRMVMTNELLCWGWSLGTMAYGDKWRRHRQMFQQYLQQHTLSEYYPLLQNGFVGSIVLQAAYGYEVKPQNDFFIKLVETASEPLLLVVSGLSVVEFLPVLKYVPYWFPGANFKRIDAKKSIASGVSKKCFVYDKMEELKSLKSVTPKEVKEEEEIIKNCAGIFFLAGADTTSALLLSWILTMKRGQEEADRVLGLTKLPDPKDRVLMPYVEAMLLETMRMWTVTPLGVPHAVTGEDVYQGYRIPAGATILPNVWAILHDDRVYPDPMTYNPERFLDNGKISFESQPDPLTIGSFGYGRRVCPGRHLAVYGAWIAIVSILATMNIDKAVDKEGRVIIPPEVSTDGLIVHPLPFKAKFSLRSNAARELIESAKIENGLDRS